jgi:hypothetical protein
MLMDILPRITVTKASKLQKDWDAMTREIENSDAPRDRNTLEELKNRSKIGEVETP